MASEGAPCRRSFTGESAQNLAKSGSRRSYVGKVAPALVDRGAGGLLRWPETEHVPLSGWESTMCQFDPQFRGRIGDERTICALRGGRAAFERGQVRNEAAASWAYGGPFPLLAQIAPRFSGETGRDGRRGGSAKEGGTGGPRARLPRLARALVAGPWLEPRLVEGPLARTPPIGFPIRGNRGHLATTPLIESGKEQHPVSHGEAGCE